MIRDTTLDLLQHHSAIFISLSALTVRLFFDVVGKVCFVILWKVDKSTRTLRLSLEGSERNEEREAYET